MYNVAALVLLLVFHLVRSQRNNSAVFCEQQSRLQLDKMVYVRGETLMATCKLPDVCHPYAANVYLQMGDITLPMSGITRQNTSFTVSTQHVVERAQNNVHLSCGVNAEGDDLLHSDHVIMSHGTPISVGVKPSPVESINCTVFAYVAMNCSYWPKTQDTGINTTYAMYFQSHTLSPDYYDEAEPCAHQEGNTCMFAGLIQAYYKIIVVAKNILGNETSSFDFNVDYLVKLNIVNSLTVETIGTSWVYFTWNKPYDEHHEHYVTYRFNLTAPHGTPSQLVSYNTTLALQQNITGLVPYVKYHVIIEALPLIKERNRPYVIAGFWNDPGSLDVTTLPDVPGVAPEVIPGGFRIEKDMLELFWKSVPRREQHGNLVHHRVRLYQHSVDDSVSCEGAPTITWLLDNTNISDRQPMPEDGPYDMCLDVKNQVGYNESLQLTPIRISKDVLHTPRFYARVNEDDDHQVEIRILENTSAVSYTIYWCKTFSWEKSCRDKELHWNVVNASRMIHTVGHNLPRQQTVVAMSAEYINKVGDVVSSGMKLAPHHHIFNKYLSDIEPPKDLVSEGGQGGKIFIEWNKPLKASTVYIYNFTVDYCIKETCENPAAHHNISYPVYQDLDGTKQTVELTDLKEEKTYEIRVRSDGDKQTSIYTEAIAVYVPKSGLTKNTVIAISVVSVIALLLVTAGIYTLVRECRKRYIRHKEPILVIMPPEFNLEENDNVVKSNSPYSDIEENDYAEMQETRFKSEDQEGPGKSSDTPPEGNDQHVNSSITSEQDSLLYNGDVTSLLQEHTGTSHFIETPPTNDDHLNEQECFDSGIA